MVVLLLSSGEGVDVVDQSFWMVAQVVVNCTRLHCQLSVDTATTDSSRRYRIGRTLSETMVFDFSLHLLV